MYEDTYFLNAQEAFNEASLQNRWGENNYFLQVCYYDGEKIESEFANLIHLPIENLVESLAYGTYRIPTKLETRGLELSNDIKLQVFVHFNISIQNAKMYREENNIGYLKALRESKLDFSEPLRFFIMASTSTQVMQYIAKNIADTLQEMGHDVLFDLRHGIEDMNCLKKILIFNPHATININHLNNGFLSEDVFNFVWFQDPMPILTNNMPLCIRERDYIFSYATLYTKLLKAKGVEESKIFKKQVIPVDTKQFYLDTKVQREDKIVFVGSFYGEDDGFKLDARVDQELKNILENGGSLSTDVIQAVCAKYDFHVGEDLVFFNHIQQSYIRNSCVANLCSTEKKRVEVYGYNWQECGNADIISKFKGKVEKEQLNQLYNSAKYALAASGQVINTQRLGEIIHAGAIPVVYDSRSISDEDETWDEECLYFKTKEELHYILDNSIEPKKYRSHRMMAYFTYDDFMQTIFEEIDKKTK